MPYQSNARLSDLLIEQGRVVGDRRRASGQLWGDVVRGVAALPDRIDARTQAIAAAEMGRRQQESALANADLQRRVHEGTLAGQRREIAQDDAARALAAKTQAVQEWLADVASNDVPDVMNAAYRSGRDRLIQQGVLTPQDAPEFFPGQSWVRSRMAMILPATERFKQLFPEPEKGVVLPRGARISHPVTGDTIADNPMTPDAPTVGSFEDFVVRQFGPNPTADQIADARRRYQQADDRPLAPIVIQTPTGVGTLDRGSNTVRPVTDAQGNVLGPAPTEAQRNEARQYAKAEPILASLSDLSERINTQQGAIARIAGAAERAKAQINLNDDVAEYESIISGFTPLIARALGHTGVLTEQDVQSVKAMFPRPGDSKSLRDRKIARIQQLMGAIEGASAGGSATGTDDRDPLNLGLGGAR